MQAWLGVARPGLSQDGGWALAAKWGATAQLRARGLDHGSGWTGQAVGGAGGFD
eukprot:SAG31_NODE_3599_length_4085_cov_4.147516_3_plen_54_part_00